MTPTRRLPRLLLLHLLFAGCASAADAPAPAPAPASGLPPVERFFENAAISSVAISPDGQRVALRIGGPGKNYVIGVVDVATLQPTPVAAFADQDIEDFRWVGPHRLVFNLRPKFKGPTSVDCGSGLFGVNDDGTDYRKLVESCLSFVKAPPMGVEPLPWNTWPIGLSSPPDDDTVFVEQPSTISKERGLDYFRLLRLDTRTGRAPEIEVPLHSNRFVLDHAGRLRAVVTQDKNLSRVLVLDSAGAWQKIDEFDSAVEGGMRPLHIDGEGRLFLSGGRNRDTRALYIYDTNLGRFVDKPLLSSGEFDVNPEVLTSQDRVLGVRYTTDSVSTAWFDPRLKTMQAALDKRLPGRVNLIHLPRSAIPDTVLVTSFADRLPRAFYLYQSATDKLTLLGASRTGIDPRQMGKQLFVKYKARDGREIPAYVTFPPDRERKGLALVVLVHGGPFLRGASWGWDPQVQFLAARGYAVLQPEYRGSEGFGEEHFHAGWRQWGQKMQDDIADGARWLASEGVVDANRICIMGASYGGYATLMGLARDPDLYRCGVAWAAVTDLRLLSSWAWGNTSDVYKQYGLPRLVGDETEDAEMLRANSPVENAAKIRAPLLLAHGTYDNRVPIIHGERMRDLLADHHPGFEWIQYSEEPHGWIHEKTNIDFWARVEKFLAVNLAPSPAGAVASASPSPTATQGVRP